MDQLSIIKLLSYTPISGTESCTCHFIGEGKYHVTGCPYCSPDCRYVRNDAQRQEIMEMFNEGLSMGIIADKLGTTRGAIAGVISRQRKKGVLARQIQPQYRKLSSKPTPVTEHVPIPQWFKASVVSVKPVKKKRIRLRLIDNDTEVTLLELQPHQCKYPLGDPKLPDFRFCGCHRIASSPYCEKHTVICVDARYARWAR